MEDILCEPVELIESDLDEVAGGDPFGNAAVAVVTQNLANVGNIVGLAKGLVARVIANIGTIIGLHGSVLHSD